jgi:hypothetical protein
MIMFPTIRAQALILELTSRVALKLCHAQKWLLWTSNINSRVQHASSFHRILSKIPHAQYVDAVIGRIASVGDDHLETDVRSANTGMDVTDLRRPSVGTVPVLVKYRVSSTALVPQLQFWHPHWLVSDNCSHVCQRYQ